MRVEELATHISSGFPDGKSRLNPARFTVLTLQLRTVAAFSGTFMKLSKGGQQQAAGASSLPPPFSLPIVRQDRQESVVSA
jgi:hypothetical protein